MSTESNTPVDPRVQIELEKLNTATDNINRYEVELDEAKCEFKRLLAESVVRIKAAAHKLGNSIDAAKPYYESRIYAAQLAKETQQAAANHEKAKSIHAAAKEMVYLAEQGLGEKSTLDTACQEMLSHAASKVNQSQLEVTDTRNALKMCQLKLEVANNRVGKLQGQLKQALRASRPYYETRANYNGLLKAQKLRVNELEAKVSSAKMTYNEALKNLEQISEDIHRQRQQRNNLLNYEAMLRQVDTPGAIKAETQVESEQVLNNVTSNANEEDEEEYLSMPERLSISGASSPHRSTLSDPHDCPHLLQDFEAVLTFPSKRLPKSASASATDGDSLFAQSQGLHGPYDSTTPAPNQAQDQDIEQWTEIRLSHSDSTSSSYSNQSRGGLGGLGSLEPDIDAQSQHSTSSSDEPKRKVTCTTIFHQDQDGGNEGMGSGQQQMSRKQSLSQWLSRSNSFKSSGRRQSFDLLIDAGDKVKDVFNYGFQKVGRTLERRNSESEMAQTETGGAGAETEALLAGSTTTTPSSVTTSTSLASGNASGGNTSDFFLFSRSSEPKELLSDEQVENLLLNHTVDEHGAIIVEELKSPTTAMQQQKPQHPLSVAGAARAALLF
ncbi:SH3 domain-binding protein 5 isoform X3 [Drosophila tropicalis]|uniref:SH3 domain-binding protein 5 isoform X3 n=1 Tax=Drosophila tropicalis TaxID=46794 RepID=UPI0035ABE0FC